MKFLGPSPYKLNPTSLSISPSRQVHRIDLLVSSTDTEEAAQSFSLLAANNMISPKKLIKMARKWQNMGAKGRNSKPCLPEKGHFVVYSTDRKRFTIPLEYINCNIFQELLRMSEEEFGLPSNGPLVMPCDSVVMEYIVSLAQRGAAGSLEGALLNSTSTGQSSLSVSCQESKSQNLPIFAHWDKAEQP